MYFYSLTWGLLVTTLLSVFSFAMAKPLAKSTSVSGNFGENVASSDDPNACNNSTPGYNSGAEKQYFRETRDAGDATLDGAQSLIKKKILNSSNSLRDGGEALCDDYFSSFISSFNGDNDPNSPQNSLIL